MEKQTSAATRPSSVLLEQLSVCVNKGEPLLLVGETGTGKTSTVQYLANIAGLQIRVVNMNQQSDTADLLGGYKPVDHKLVLPPLRKSFKNLFSQTFSRRQNSTFLGHVQSYFREKCWQDLLKLMDHVCKSAVNKEPQKKQQNAALLKEQWEAFSLRLSQAQQQIKLTETALVFAFVEVLSRAFRNRFVELHFDELPSGELESILHKRCSLPPSYCTKLIRVMLELQSHRRGSTVFVGKHGFITLRDLFRCAERYRLAEENQRDYDWLQHLANEGFMLLAGRVRKPEEAAIIQGVLEKHFKKKLNPGALFSQQCYE